MEKYFVTTMAGLLVVGLFFATVTLWVHKGRRFYASFTLFILMVLFAGPMGTKYIMHPEWQDSFEGACIGGIWGGLFLAAIYIRDNIRKEMRPDNVWKGPKGVIRIFFTALTLLATVLFFCFLL